MADSDRRRTIWLPERENVGMDGRQPHQERLPLMAGLWLSDGLVEGALVKRRRRNGVADYDLLHRTNRHVRPVFRAGGLGYL